MLVQIQLVAVFTNGLYTILSLPWEKTTRIAPLFFLLTNGSGSWTTGSLARVRCNAPNDRCLDGGVWYRGANTQLDPLCLCRQDSKSGNRLAS